MHMRKLCSGPYLFSPLPVFAFVPYTASLDSVSTACALYLASLLAPTSKSLKANKNDQKQPLSKLPACAKKNPTGPLLATVSPYQDISVKARTLLTGGIGQQNRDNVGSATLFPPFPARGGKGGNGRCSVLENLHRNANPTTP